MIYNDIIRKIRERIDEVGVNETVSLNFPVEPFISEAANQILMSAPLHIANNITDFSDSELTSSDDGSGVVELPDSFARLVEFQMEGWKHRVKAPTPLSDSLLKRQQNRMTKANDSSPIVAIDENKLLYFNVKEGQQHKISRARAQVFITDVSTIPDELVDALSWLVASKTLQVMNEKSLSEQAFSQHAYLMSILK